MLHDQLAQIRGFDFGLGLGVDVVFDRQDDLLDLLVADRPLPAGLFQALLDLLTLERGAGPSFLTTLIVRSSLRSKVVYCRRQSRHSRWRRMAKPPSPPVGFEHAIAVLVAERALDRIVDALERVVAGLAGQALAAAADRKAVVAGARIDDPIVIHSATRALHRETDGPRFDGRDRAQHVMEQIVLPHNTKIMGAGQRTNAKWWCFLSSSILKRMGGRPTRFGKSVLAGHAQRSSASLMTVVHDSLIMAPRSRGSKTKRRFGSLFHEMPGLQHGSFRGRLYCQHCGRQIDALPADRSADLAKPRQPEPAAAIDKPLADRTSPRKSCGRAAIRPRRCWGRPLLSGAVSLLCMAGMISLIVRQSPFWLWGLILLLVIWIAFVGRLAAKRLGIHYKLTNQMFYHRKGILTRTTDRIEVIDIDDITYQQGLLDRLVNVGRIEIRSSDQSNPKILDRGRGPRGRCRQEDGSSTTCRANSPRGERRESDARCFGQLERPQASPIEHGQRRPQFKRSGPSATGFIAGLITDRAGHGETAQ